MNKIPAIIVDIDGTIADCSHRLHYIQGEVKDWDGFYSGISEDRPRQDIIDLIKSLSLIVDFPIIFITGRSKKYFNETSVWIRKYIDPSTFPMGLYMRKEGDHRQDYEVKKEIYENEIKNRYDVKYVFEDRDQVVKMYRELRLTVLQVADGAF